MSIQYLIRPEFNLLIYLFDGRIRADDYFRAYEHIYLDPRRHHGMRILMDVRAAELEYSVTDFKSAISLIRSNHDNGFPPDHVAMVSPRRTLQFFSETLTVMADELPMYLQVFHNFVDALRWLEIGEQWDLDADPALVNFLSTAHFMPV